MADGDAVLRLDDLTCMEIAGLAHHWDATMRTKLAHVLAQTCERATLAIARRGGVLFPADHALWAELREELLGGPVNLEPLLALPAR